MCIVCVGGGGWGGALSITNSESVLKCVPALMHMTALPPTTLLKFCRQVAEGLSYLAGKSFVHRDIAARNILLDQELNCKVIIKTNCMQYGEECEDVYYHNT